MKYAYSNEKKIDIKYCMVKFVPGGNTEEKEIIFYRASHIPKIY